MRNCTFCSKTWHEINLTILRLAGHVIRKEDQKIRKKILFAQPSVIRKREKTKLHWRDEVDEDARMFGIKNQWMVARDHNV